MKKSVILLFAIFSAVVTISAQQIAVVNGSGKTSVFEDLNLAITSAEDGSTIYLPGGGFQVKDETKITKRVTIMGIGHKADGDNADGNSIISGNLNFASGSDGSAVMGVFLSGDVNIGTDDDVKNILIRYCNVKNIEVKNDSCSGVVVNQNYIRENCHMGGTNAFVSNNVMNGIDHVNGGQIINNIFSGAVVRIGYYSTPYTYSNVNNSTVKYNIHPHGFYSCNNNLAQFNTENSDFSAIFVSWKGISTESDLHFLDTYEGVTDRGIYSGTGFSDDCLPPMPRIVSKNIAEQTDAQGKLKVQVIVKSK